jgi:threonine dehydrogenase-like Zn-dependent dehydrogenase
MRALIFDGSAVKYRPDQPDPAPADGEVLVKVLAAGICQTDWEIAKGYMAFKGVLGHEFVGTVIKLGKGVDAKWLRKRVCAEINCVCGKCDMCARGLSTHCLRRTVIGIHHRDGAFADLLTVPVRNLHAVPDHVTDEEAVFVEPLAAAFQILRQVQIEKRTRALVLGDGRLGLLVAQVLRRTGCQLTLVGRHEKKLAVAERMQAAGANQGTLRISLDSELQSHRDQDVVIDCTGRSAGFERALELVRPRGIVVLKTTVAGGKPINLAPVVIDEITILGSRCGPFTDAIAALAAREIDVLPLVSRRIRLDQSEPLFAPGESPEGLKIILTFEK